MVVTEWGSGTTIDMDFEIFNNSQPALHGVQVSAVSVPGFGSTTPAGFGYVTVAAGSGVAVAAGNLVIIRGRASTTGTTTKKVILWAAIEETLT